MKTRHLTFALALLATGAVAHANVSDPQVRARMDLMQQIKDATGVLGNIAKQPATYDQAAAEQARADLIAASAKVATAFEDPATDPVAEASPSIWENWDDFTAKAREVTHDEPFDAVMDLVGGDMTHRFIDTMIFDMTRRRTYPRLSIAGASGGNVSEMLWTRIYLYQVQIFGVSHGTREEAEQLIAWIRSGDLKPVLHAAFKLSELHEAERYFMDRSSNYLGKIVIVPDAQWDAHGAPHALAP